MNFIFTLVIVFAVFMLIIVALSLGFVLLMWFLFVALCLSLFMLARRLWWRWRFVHLAEERERFSKVIEGEFVPVDDEEKP